MFVIAGGITARLVSFRFLSDFRFRFERPVTRDAWRHQ